MWCGYGFLKVCKDSQSVRNKILWSEASCLQETSHGPDLYHPYG